MKKNCINQQNTENAQCNFLFNSCVLVFVFFKGYSPAILDGQIENCNERKYFIFNLFKRMGYGHGCFYTSMPRSSGKTSFIFALLIKFSKTNIFFKKYYSILPLSNRIGLMPLQKRNTFIQD